MSDPHSEYYSLLRTCFAEPPQASLLKKLCQCASSPPIVTGHPLITNGWQLLDHFFSQHSEQKVPEIIAETHYFFFGNPLGAELEPYASYYTEGNRQGTALIKVRQFLHHWHLVPVENGFKDFEDHAIFLLDCLVQLAALIEQEGEQWHAAMEQCLTDLVLPWMPIFLTDLKTRDHQHLNGGFYAGLASIGLGVLDLEKQVLKS